MSEDDRGQRLGRGLSALLGEDSPATAVSEHPQHVGIAKELSVDQLRPNPFQPRQRVDEAEIEALADSIL